MTGTLRSQYRDALKYDMRAETIISVIGLENQSSVDRDMVLRVMKYNAASYQSQINKREACRRPVFTLVLYFGNKRWFDPKTVMETLKLDDMSTGNMPHGKYAGELVMDGRLNVYEIAFLPKEIRKQFTSDFRIAADYFCVVREGKEGEFRKDKRAFKHREWIRKLLKDTVTIYFPGAKFIYKYFAPFLTHNIEKVH